MNKGYIAFTTLIIVSAVVLVIATTVSLLAIGEAQSGLAASKGQSAYFAADGCMEEALARIWASNSYNGGTVTTPEGTCNISLSKNGNTWTVNATTAATDYKKTIQVVATRSATLTIGSWKEL